MSQSPSLIRVMGRWSLVALVINSVIGGSIFGLPGEVARLLGKYSPLAYLVAAAGVALIIMTFAEVSSRFTVAGGPYLYAREAFGSFVGVQMGWLLWLVRLTAVASGSNLISEYMAEFWPAANDPIPRAVILIAIIGGLAAVNYRGAKGGAQVSNVFAAAKLTPLFIFAIVGTIYYLAGSSKISLMMHQPQSGYEPWLQAILMLVFAYGGYESAMVPMGEAKDPKRDAPFALIAALLICIVMYTLVQTVVIGFLENPGANNRPLAVAARQFWGAPGAMLMTAGALISLYGWLAANTLNVPRLTFALAENRDFPKFFAAVHPKFHTPYVSIVFYAIVVLALALFGSFKWNLMLSSVARLFTYILVCGSLLVFRQRHAEPAPFHVRGGAIWAVLGILFSMTLITQMGADHAKIMAVTFALALGTWLWARRRQEKA